MATVDVFEFMIGNTDWSVSRNHNIKFITPRKDPKVVPYPIPYDFDFCGLVNAGYAKPPESLGISTVKDRLYRGYKRSMEELAPILQKFNEHKPAIYDLINNNLLLQASHKKQMLSYLSEFYSIINNKKAVQSYLIDGARTL
jgi:hypothetical protein